MMKKIIILLLAAFSFYGIYAAEFTGISRELPENTLQIMQIDTFGIVADIYFIRLPDGRVIVVDTGEFKTADSTLIAALDRFGIKEIDTLILTHFHLDHVGGTFSLLNDPEIRIKKVLYTSMPYEEIPGTFSKELFRRIMYMIERKEIPLQALQPGDKLDFGCGVTALVVGTAERGSKNRDLNGHSLVFHLK
jgi:beta-lactamase superfamily II metal-dependent hydrolase